MFLMLFVCSPNNEVALFCVCVVCFLFVNKTTVLFLFASCGLVSFLGCVVSNFIFFCSFIPFKKRTLQKTQKNKNAEKTTKIMLAQLCSQIVFLIFGVGCKNTVFAESPIRIGVSAYFEKGKKGQKYEKGWVKNGNCWSYFFFCFCLKSHSPCRKKNIFEKQKRKKEETLDRFLNKKANLAQIFNSTAYLFILIFICWRVLNLRKRSAKWKKKTRKRQILGCNFGGSSTHPLNEVVFSAFFGFALPGAPMGSDKNTVSGAALSPAVSGFLGSLKWSPLLPIFWGEGPGVGGLCVSWKSTRSSSRNSRAKKKKLKSNNNRKGKTKTRRSRRRRRRRWWWWWSWWRKK